MAWQGSTTTMRCCDRDCAEVNGCRVGGVECAECGRYYCAYELTYADGKHICDECLAERDEVEEENEVYGEEADDGE